MAREVFVEKTFRRSTMAVIEQANVIVAEYGELGFALTLRQLYYQFVARGLIENRQSEYKRLGCIINDARLAGLIDWDTIEDRTRHLRRLSSWDNPADIIESAAESYRQDLWAGQDYRPEVWIEKDALLGVIEGVCNEYRVPYFACRGNNSQSEQYVAGKRFVEARASGFTPIVFHLGDHDPNGLDMTRDNRDRLAMFAGEPVEVRRLALNIDQVEQYGPPPNPAKDTDSRYAGHVEKFGESSWELDALDPTMIADLVREAIKGLIDRRSWKAAKAEERNGRDMLATASGNWAEVEHFLRSSRGDL
jgi:hypothetical protein